MLVGFNPKGSEAPPAPVMSSCVPPTVPSVTHKPERPLGPGLERERCLGVALAHVVLALYQWLCWLTHRGFPNRGGADSSWRGGSRHGFSGEIARGLFGCGASGVGPAVEELNQSRRLLSLAAVRDGMDRGSAAKIGGMGRQTLRDWVHRFNGSGPEGLVDNWTDGPKPRLSAEQLAQFAQIVEAGPDREKDGVVRWRRLDLKRVIAERFGIDFHPRYVGKLLKKLGFSHISARPRHPAQDERTVEAFKKTSRAR